LVAMMDGRDFTRTQNSKWRPAQKHYAIQACPLTNTGSPGWPRQAYNAAARTLAD